MNKTVSLTSVGHNLGIRKDMQSYVFDTENQVQCKQKKKTHSVYEIEDNNSRAKNIGQDLLEKLVSELQLERGIDICKAGN